MAQMQQRPTKEKQSARPMRLALILALLALPACEMSMPSAVSMLDSDAGAPTRDLALTKDLMDMTSVKAELVPTINGMGYASISAQPASSRNQQRLMAIRAARMEAVRNLTEQVHGIRIDSQTMVSDAVVQNDTLRAQIQGLIRGARTVRITPMGTDTYEVVLELDRDMVRYLLKAARA